MSEPRQTTLDRFRAQPRGVQWALLGAIGLILFFAWDSYLRPLASHWSDRASAIQTKVNEVRAGRQVSEKLMRSASLVKAMGPVEPPPSEAAGTKEVNDAVNAVIAKHGLKESFSLRRQGGLGASALPSVTKGRRVEKLMGELKFESTPATAIAVLSELESNPYINAVPSVRLTRGNSGRVNVHLTLESWALSVDSSSSSSAMSGAAR